MTTTAAGVTWHFLVGGIVIFLAFLCLITMSALLGFDLAMVAVIGLAFTALSFAIMALSFQRKANQNR